jgi:HSP20 family protein
MANSQWDPLREMEDLLERYGRPRAAAGGAAQKSEHIAMADWRPIVDISESAEEYLIEAELPGVRREEVRVSVEEGVLTVQGQRDARADQDTRRYHRRERAHGHFARSFALPESADLDRINARCEDGVLLISIAKLAERRKRGVEIKVG